MMMLLYLFNLVALSMAFECYTCNDGPHDDDTKPCREMKSVCQSGVTSCSMLVYRSTTKTHMRKFCSAKHTPLYQYLQLLPGSSMCQNINANAHMARWRRSVGPPAPPTESTSLLCVCSTPLCNAGTYETVIENTMMNNLSQKTPPLSEENMIEEVKEPLPPAAFESQPNSDLLLQMNNAGF